MTTHLSDVDSLCSVSIQRPHMRITMEENQIELAPREVTSTTFVFVYQYITTLFCNVNSFKLKVFKGQR